MIKKRIKISLYLAFFILGTAIFKADAEVITASLAQKMRKAEPEEEIAVIVIMSDRINPFVFKDKYKGARRTKLVRALKAKAALTQASIREYLRRRKTEKIKPLWINNSIAVTAAQDIIAEIANLPGVETIRLDTVLEAPKSAVSYTCGEGWNLNAIGAPEFWQNGYRGKGIVVAAMDTGVDADHPDLAPSWRGGDNSWFDPNAQHLYPYDASGHGTQVMGILVGSHNNGSEIGISPDSQWIAVKIFNDQGFTTFSKIHQGFQWLLDPDGDPSTDDAPDVVNNSWGLDGTLNDVMLEFSDDIHALRAAGIAVTFSAGNDGPSSYTSSSPANNPESFSIGGIEESYTIAPFSSRGPSAYQDMIYPHVVAPAVNIKSCDLSSGGTIGNSYVYVCGTSFASPHAAASMALLLSAEPSASVSEIESALKNSSLDLGQQGPDNDYGYGLINIPAAHQSLSIPPIYADEDGDGYNNNTDCDDHNPAVHPDAPEVKHDDIDQDCNCFDLTIEITKAVYNQRARVLCVEASSTFGSSANLVLNDYGPMRYMRLSNKWMILIGRLEQPPETVTVTGLEGSETASVSKSNSPYPPSGLAIKTETPHSVMLGWKDNSGNERFFIIERKEGENGLWRRVGIAGKNNVSFIDRSARPGKNYFYRVCARNEFGASEYSNVSPFNNID